MKTPLVSCIMPTANRDKYIQLAINNFLNQDYSNIELVIIDDGNEPVSTIIADDPRIKYYYFQGPSTIGMKRNYACQHAHGDIIMHWDDDDWYANDWISHQLKVLDETNADICGVEHVNFYSPTTNMFWKGTALNRNNHNTRQWISGATIAYKKSFWMKNNFKNLQTAEDDNFIDYPNSTVFAHDYIDGFVALLHPDNTTLKYFEDSRNKKKSQLA